MARPRHFINVGEQLKVGPLRILINGFNGDHTKVDTFVFYGEKGRLGSARVSLEVAEDLKRELSEVTYGTSNSKAKQPTETIERPLISHAQLCVRCSAEVGRYHFRGCLWELTGVVNMHQTKFDPTL